jgi:hypothetical protein
MNNTVNTSLIRQGIYQMNNNNNNQIFIPNFDYINNNQNLNCFIRRHTNNHYDVHDLQLTQVSGDHQMNPNSYPNLNYYVEQCNTHYIISKISRINYYYQRVGNRNKTRSQFYLYNIKIVPMTQNSIITRALTRLNPRVGITYESINENIFNNIENINEEIYNDEEYRMEELEDMFE